MSSEEAKKFRENQKINGLDYMSLDKNSYGHRENYQNKVRTNNKNEQRRVTTKQKGKARRLARKKLIQRIKLGAAAALLATGIGVGAMTVRGWINQDPEPTITQMQENGVNLNEFNLAEDTINSMKKYDQYFEEWNNGEINKEELTNQEIADMLKEIKDINFNVIKDKVASLNNVERKDITLAYRGEEDGVITTIAVKENDYGNKKVYSNSKNFFGKSENSIESSEISSLILQLEDFDNLSDKLKDNDISKANAIKKLEKLYQNITKFAQQELVMDERGNLNLEEIEDVKEAKEKIEEEMDR